VDMVMVVVTEEVMDMVVTETNTNITEGADGSKLCIKFYLLFLLPQKSSICSEFFSSFYPTIE